MQAISFDLILPGKLEALGPSHCVTKLKRAEVPFQSIYYYVCLQWPTTHALLSLIQNQTVMLQILTNTDAGRLLCRT